MFWTTTTEFVDVETGEVITAREVEKGIYVKLKLKTKYEKSKNRKDYGYRRNTWFCERNRQTRLF